MKIISWIKSVIHEHSFDAWLHDLGKDPTRIKVYDLPTSYLSWKRLRGRLLRTNEKMRLHEADKKAKERENREWNRTHCLKNAYINPESGTFLPCLKLKAHEGKCEHGRLCTNRSCTCFGRDN